MPSVSATSNKTLQEFQTTLGIKFNLGVTHQTAIYLTDSLCNANLSYSCLYLGK